MALLTDIAAAVLLLASPDPIFNRIWWSIAPSNVKVFTWRLVLDRISSKEILWKRKVLQSQEEITCSVCGVVAETSAHIVVSCPFSVDVWRGYYHWLGVQTALPLEPRAHLLQFVFGLNKLQQKCAFAIWLVAAWSIWLNCFPRWCGGYVNGYGADQVEVLALDQV
ncbi:uncharacterized protein LOC130713522 [Lotus japonicus]|uniref:uncharacterized protein LOC130713522 n=1 Tax=Lotus japonicus TaxID=34305 RepID=UPI00258A4369|nr:uncharacterized protein LOC130713522 [Lotus japonicus]XP_057419271.1 uncharacterized protein LOC130713522 [Lotus japonicus]